MVIGENDESHILQARGDARCDSDSPTYCAGSACQKYIIIFDRMPHLYDPAADRSSVQTCLRRDVCALVRVGDTLAFLRERWGDRLAEQSLPLTATTLSNTNEL
ncbi:MAG: hypothetical protein C0183_06065 [Roseiflexus castenholzii]|nr:MAG: hypothetical protein C0183_06065 [Roseiflexus castenholzii]